MATPQETRRISEIIKPRNHSALGQVVQALHLVINHLTFDRKQAQQDPEYLERPLPDMKNYMGVVSEGTTTEPSVHVWRDFVPEFAKLSGNILYVGSGDGALARYLTDQIVNYRKKHQELHDLPIPTFVCIDVSQASIEQADELNNVRYPNIQSYKADILNLPEHLQHITQNSEVLIDFNLLHHLVSDGSLPGDINTIIEYFQATRRGEKHKRSISIEPKHGPNEFLAMFLAGIKGLYKGGVIALDERKGLKGIIVAAVNGGFRLAHDTLVSFKRCLTNDEIAILNKKFPELIVQDTSFYRIYDSHINSF